MFAKRIRMLIGLVLALTLLCVIDGGESAYKIAHGSPVPVIKNAPYIYRGQVFILRETDDPKTPFVAEIVNGGIEMVLQPPKPMPAPMPLPVQPLNNYLRKNDSLPEVMEDPEYFAVLVTAETAGLAQISRSMVIEVPMVMLLTGITKRMPWVLVLKRKNHFEYFRNLEPQLAPIQVIAPQRRRNRSHESRIARLVTDSHKFDLLYSDKDKAVFQNICTNLVEELAYLNTLLQQYTSETESFDFLDQLSQNKSDKNETSDEFVVPESLDKYLIKLVAHDKSQKNTDSNKNSH